MRVFAISDLHLPGGEAKPMDIFGLHWENHFEKIQADWQQKVAEDDLVLIAGDISWAMRLADAASDLEAIGALPGRKVILRGNHDYWWSSISRVRAALPEGMYAIQHDALTFGDVIICGTRGWISPDSAQATEDDTRIYQREAMRLSLSLAEAEKMRETLLAQGKKPRIIAMLHYPPFGDKAQASEVTALLSEAGVDDAIYGHLHGPGLQGAFTGTLDGVRYHLTSCDGLGFQVYAL